MCQALGRLLTHGDINERLKGRRAELLWPDDNLWYLIEIHEVDLANHKAQACPDLMGEHLAWQRSLLMRHTAFACCII